MAIPCYDLEPSNISLLYPVLQGYYYACRIIDPSLLTIKSPHPLGRPALRILLSTDTLTIYTGVDHGVDVQVDRLTVQYVAVMADDGKVICAMVVI